MADAVILSDEYTIGDDWVFTLTLTRGGSAVNVTGATVTTSIWRMADDTEVLPDQSVALTTAASGIVTLTLADTVTEGLKEGTYKGDVKVVYSDLTEEHFGPYFFEAVAAYT